MKKMNFEKKRLVFEEKEKTLVRLLSQSLF